MKAALLIAGVLLAATTSTTVLAAPSASTPTMSAGSLSGPTSVFDVKKKGKGAAHKGKKARR